MIELLFMVMGVLAFWISLTFWYLNWIRAKRAKILDYSMFSVNALFALCGIFGIIMLVMGIRYFVKENPYGFRISMGTAILFLSSLLWNTGFVTKKGLYMVGIKPMKLTAVVENEILLLVPEELNWRVQTPFGYLNTPENREKFAIFFDKNNDKGN
ncbi:MAG TPA: hypothetical protein DCO72_04220 [Ruminococcus sp.]|nr:hypothetical protein [Ruminococcus sp.]